MTDFGVMTLDEARFFAYSDKQATRVLKDYTCAEHPRYQASNIPAVPCPSCWVVYLQKKPQSAKRLL